MFLLLLLHRLLYILSRTKLTVVTIDLVIRHIFRSLHKTTEALLGRYRFLDFCRHCQIRKVLAQKPPLAARMAHQEVPRVPQQSIPSRSLPGNLNETLDYMDYEEPVGHTPVAGALTSFDVFAFVVNKEVGTGIFTAPSLVLALTGSREKAIILWAVGFGYSVIGSSTHLLQFTYADVGPSMLLYLSFAAVLPYNTGELLYVSALLYLLSHEKQC